MAKKEQADAAGKPLKLKADGKQGNKGGEMKILGNDPKYPQSDMAVGQDIQKGYRVLGSGLQDGMGSNESVNRSGKKAPMKGLKDSEGDGDRDAG